MSLVVEPTLPYTASTLQLQNSSRWGRLFPLIRPSVKSLELPGSQVVVVDTALTTSKHVLVAVVGRAGNFPSKVLNGSHVAAFTTSHDDKPPVSSVDISNLLGRNGFPVENGVVVVRTGLEQSLTQVYEPLELTVTGELKLDHILSLLFSSNNETKASLEKTKALLQDFIEHAVQTTSTLQEKKTGNRPSVAHATGVSEFCSAKAAVDKDLDHLLTESFSRGDFIYSVHFADLNGLSKLESSILAHEISGYLSRKNLPSHITQSTIFNDQSQARGWAISVCPVPRTFLDAQPRPANNLATETAATPSSKPKVRSKIQTSDAQVRKIIIAGCESVIKDEPTITEYDTIVGDGDCGYTLRDGAKQVLSFITSADLSQLPSALSDLVDDLEVSMGGTSGALYCIFLSSLAHELREAASFPEALKASLNHLLQYTRARLGDRTCLDCLIPFVETLEGTGDATRALVEAGNGVESTTRLEAKLGRSSYLDEAVTRGVPDPGAYGLLKLLEGMVSVVD